MVFLAGTWHMACRSDFVLRNDGTACIQLWQVDGSYLSMDGTPLECASWVQDCYDAGLDIRVKINETTSLDDGMPHSDPSVSPDAQQYGAVRIWSRELQAALQKSGVTGLSEEVIQKFAYYFGNCHITAPELFIAIAGEHAGISPQQRTHSDREGISQTLINFGFTLPQSKTLLRHIFRKQPR